MPSSDFWRSAQDTAFWQAGGSCEKFGETHNGNAKIIRRGSVSPDTYVNVMVTKAAVALYNRLAQTEPVGGLFHSTC